MGLGAELQARLPTAGQGGEVRAGAASQVTFASTCSFALGVERPFGPCGRSQSAASSKRPGQLCRCPSASVPFPAGVRGGETGFLNLFQVCAAFHNSAMLGTNYGSLVLIFV